VSWLLERQRETAGMNDSVFDREADLLYAFQFGQDYVREGNAASVEEQFMKMFSGDAEALAEFEAGKEAQRQAN